MKNKNEYESKMLPKKTGSDDRIISALDKSILYKPSKNIKSKNIENKIVNSKKINKLKENLKRNYNLNNQILKISNKKENYDIKKIKIKDYKFFLILVVCIILTIILLNKLIKENNEIKIIGQVSKIQYEQNNNPINIDDILKENISTVKRKELIVEELEINYMTVNKENYNLPKDEKVVVQAGKNGRQEVTKVCTYENDTLVEETIIETKIFEDSVQEIVEIGTSEKLKDLKIHIGDNVIVTADVELKEQEDGNGDTIINIPQYYDVKLLELVGNWSKVEFQNNIGYIKNTKYTTEAVTSGINEKSRIAKIKGSINLDMNLTEKSMLTLQDFEKILKNNSSDKNKIFEKNYMAFYNIEQKYNINGVFLASIAIHESGWGTSRIAIDKKNLFGFGSYDSSPYESSYTFNTYEEGLEVVAKSLIKNYLNPAGTIIYDGEVATGSYYNGPTLAGVNVRYASDQSWHTKVFSKMLGLYSKL